MNIKYGGFVPTTLLDFPGEVASVIFLPGCNLKCPYCHNPALVENNNESLEPIENILKKIEKRKNLISGVVITGGEPTLYDDLGKYITALKKMNLKVKLDTNGTRPDKLKLLNPDYIAMDLKTSFKKYPALGYKGDINNIIKSLNWIKNSGIEYELRTTAAPIIFNKSDLIELLPFLEGVDNYYITNFRQGITLITSYNENTPYSKEEMEEFLTICRNAGVPCLLR